MPEYKAEAVQSVTRERPSRPPEVRSDVAVPLAQAVVTATLVAIGVLMLLWPDWRAAALAWWVVALAVWLWRSDAIQRTLWQIESITMRDLDGDKRVGQPQTVVTVERDDGWQNVHLPQPPDKLAQFARGVLDGKPLAEGSWIGGKGAFSLSEYRAVRDELLAAGAIRWVDRAKRNKGFEVTPAGRRILERLADGTHTHTHTQRGVNLTLENKAGKGTP